VTHVRLRDHEVVDVAEQGVVAEIVVAELAPKI
jgi:hypothetical protein